MKGEPKGAIFHTYSTGVMTGRDAWAYNFNQQALAENMQKMIHAYNDEVRRWRGTEDKSERDVNDFVDDDDKNIKWSRDLKAKLKRGRIAEHAVDKIRRSLYRPFTKSYLFFDKVLNDRAAGTTIFPTPATEEENQVICVSGAGSIKPFHALTVSGIPDRHLTSDSQCFPFYVYDEDSTNRRENITDWALQNFRTHYGDDTLTKWDIFHYTYGLLHHPAYRERNACSLLLRRFQAFAADLRLDLPHIPYAEDFWAFVEAGAQLAELHVNYERQPQYRLKFISTPDAPLDLRVERMRLSKDKTQLKYNEYLTLAGIPAEAFA